MANRFLPFAGGWRIRFLWLLLILLAALVLFLEFIADVGGGDETQPPIAGSVPGLGIISLPDRSLLTEGQVVSVIDGDTVDVQIEGQVVRVRYYGSNAPERGEPCADEATARNRQLVEGRSVFLQADARDRDDGRLLRYVFTGEGHLVDEVLIREGLAKAWREDGVYLGQLVTIEETTLGSGEGCLWQSR